MFSRRDDLPRGFSIRDMAADQAAALQSLGIERASIMGVSQGGMIAQYLAIDFPDLIEKLVLAVTAAYPSQMACDCVGSWVQMACRGDHRALMVDTAERSYSPAYLARYRMAYPVLGMVGKPKSYDRFLANAEAILGFDARDDLGRILCPTLILAGEDDRIVGVDASYELHERITGSELYVYSGLGHAAYEEAPDFNSRVLRFLDS
jgi:pimeloyl-ACP methyl ester carboxylesterase